MTRKNDNQNQKNKYNYKRITITLILLALFLLLITTFIERKLNTSNDDSSDNSIISADSSNFIDLDRSDILEEPPDENTSGNVPSHNDTSEESEPQSEYSYEYSFDIEPYLPYIEPDINLENSYFLLLVNKSNPLDSSFIPPDLINSPNAKAGTQNPMLNKIASKALEAMLKEAVANGFNKITMSSGYRSYTTQDWWFNYYKDKYRSNYKTEEELENFVNSFSMKAGYSEHQSGLTADIYNTATNSLFNDTPAALWLADNAHKFGFILRYPKGKEDITQIIHESWHFRFVGRKAATIIYLNDWVLEEFHQEYLNKDN